jgi:CBS domain-containing protein
MSARPRRRRLPLRVEDIMVSPPVTVTKNTSIQDAARIMYEKRIGSVLVVDDEGKLVGIVTERDIVFACAQGWDASRHAVWEIMTENPATIRPSDNVVAAMEKMRQLGVRHLPVVDEEGRPVGMVSFRDIMDLVLMLVEIGVFHPALI